MKTTLDIDDGVMRRRREDAARRGATFSALVEVGVRRVLLWCQLFNVSACVQVRAVTPAANSDFLTR